MTNIEIKREWDSFIEYPNGSDNAFVTTTSALLFAEHAAAMAVKAEREACADIVEHADTPDCGGWTSQGIANAIRSRGAP